MKITVKLVLVCIGLLGLLFAVFRMKTLVGYLAHRPATTMHQQEADGSLLPSVSEMPIKGLESNQSLATTPQAIANGPKAKPRSVLPTEIRFIPSALSVDCPLLLPLVDSVSNAVLSVDRILKSGAYLVHEFSRSIWLTYEDRANSTAWTIYLYRTNAVVGSVKATVYQDVTLTQKDLSRSFRMSFYPENGKLREFSWGDSHEVFLVMTNGVTDYARDLGDQMGLVMRWDATGNLVSSNVYNWATRGRVIGYGNTNSPPTSVIP